MLWTLTFFVPIGTKRRISKVKIALWMYVNMKEMSSKTQLKTNISGTRFVLLFIVSWSSSMIIPFRKTWVHTTGFFLDFFVKFLLLSLFVVFVYIYIYNLYLKIKKCRMVTSRYATKMIEKSYIFWYTHTHILFLHFFLLVYYFQLYYMIKLYFSCFLVHSQYNVIMIVYIVEDSISW
jgi:hypothetical protein